MIQVMSDLKEVEVKKIVFSDGAESYQLIDLPLNPRYISVTVKPNTPVFRVREEIGAIINAISYNVDNFYDIKLILNIPYFPYARADRKFEEGNGIPLRNFLESICGLFDEINTCDLHNENILAGFPELNIKIQSQLECYKRTLTREALLTLNSKGTDYDIILAPDKGAKDKSITISEYLKDTELLFCEKERDMSTGKIIKSKLPDVDFTGKKVLIPDDICDGGYTFIKLAEQLKEAGAEKVDLYITHFIGSKGLDSFKGLIDNIFFYQIVGNYVNKTDIENFNKGE